MPPSVAGRAAAGVAVAGLVALALSCSSTSGKASSGTSEKGSTTASTVPGGGQYKPQIALFGDSLSWEAQPYYTSLIHSTGETALTYDSVGGTAICDWLQRMREVEATYHPHAVQLQFSGNALTPCMKAYPDSSQAYYDKYRADTQAAIDIFVPGGTRMFLIGAPISRARQSDPNWDRLNRQYAEMAAGDPQHVTYVDAGTAVEGPGHTYVETLPCLAVEPCLGAVVGGVPSNTVRSPDGVHFCPATTGNEEGVIGGCTVYSSGAFRYAHAMVEALTTVPP
jgi:hypothetical protein